MWKGFCISTPGGIWICGRTITNIRIPSACWNDYWKFVRLRVASYIAMSGSATGRSEEPPFPAKAKINSLRDRRALMMARLSGW